VNCRVGDTTPLCYAAKTNSVRAIELLLQNGADINLRNEEGFTPLMRAAEAGNVEAAEFLIKKGTHEGWLV